MLDISRVLGRNGICIVLQEVIHQKLGSYLRLNLRDNFFVIKKHMFELLDKTGNNDQEMFVEDEQIISI